MQSIRWTCLVWFGTSVIWAATVGQRQGGLAVHEWGTFTSVADAAGEPVFWQPFLAAPDLPCFVNRLPALNPKFANAYVRMETPVIYFYTPRAMAVNVSVRFPQGKITEWYPQASSMQRPPSEMQYGMTMAWRAEVDPEAEPKFPTESAPSRYYAARETDAAPVRVGGRQEKLIFYRGIGYFKAPLRPKFTADDKVVLTNDGETIPAAIVFENRAGKIRWRRVDSLGDQATVEALPARGDVRQEMEGILTAQGLFEKEARAMLATWNDSWFEEGARVLYIVPRAVVDRVLPLAVEPAPESLARVFVGRVEMRAPWMAEEMGQALAADNPAPLEKYGRFLQPFVMARDSRPGPRVRAFLDAAYQRASLDAGRACGQ